MLFTLTGSGFVEASVAYLGETILTTTFVDAATLEIEIPQELLLAGEYAIRVFNPTPEGGLSDPVTLSVVYPVPTLNSVSPVSGDAGTELIITLIGSQFKPVSQTFLGETELDTTYLSGGFMEAVIPVELALEGTYDVTVVTGAPGGGTSAPFSYEIENAIPLVVSYSPFRLSFDTTGFYPYMALNPGTGELLVAWTDYSEDGNGIVMGQLVGPDGALVGSEITISTMGAEETWSSNQAMVFDPITSRYTALMVNWGPDWERNDTDIYGRFIGSDGTPEAGEFALLATPEVYDYPTGTVAANGQHYVTYTTEAPDDADLYISAMNSLGVLVGTQILLAPYAYDADLTDGEGIDQLLVTWSDRTEQTYYGQLFDYNLTPLTSAFPIMEGPLPTWYPARSAFNPATEEYLIVWSDLDANGGRIYASRISSTGELLSALPISDGDHHRSPVVACNRDTGEYLVVWHHDTAPDYSLYAQKLDVNGEPIQGQFYPNITGDKGQDNPALTYSAVSSAYFLTWDQRVNCWNPYPTEGYTEQSHVWGRFLDGATDHTPTCTWPVGQLLDQRELQWSDRYLEFDKNGDLWVGRGGPGYGWGSLFYVDPQGSGFTEYATGAAITQMVMDPTGTYVTTCQNGWYRFCRFNVDTRVEYDYSVQGNGDVLPWGITYDGNGDIIYSTFAGKVRKVSQLAPTGLPGPVTYLALYTGAANEDIRSIYKHPTRSEIWCCCYATKKIKILDETTLALLNSVDTSGYGSTQPLNIAFDSNGHAWVTQYGVHPVLEIDPSTLVVTAHYTDTFDQIRISNTDQGDFLWLTGERGVTLMNTAGDMLGCYPIGYETHGLAVDPNGQDIWVAAFDATNAVPVYKLRGCADVPACNPPVSINFDTAFNFGTFNPDSMAHSSVTGRFISCRSYSSTSARFEIVNGDGTVYAAEAALPLLAGHTQSRYPSCAYGGGQYLVACTQPNGAFGKDAVGCFVSETGVASAAFVIHDDTLGETGWYKPCFIAYNPDDDEFLVAVFLNRGMYGGDSEFRFFVVSSSGTVTPGSVMVMSDLHYDGFDYSNYLGSNNGGNVNLVYNAIDEEYLLTFGGESPDTTTYYALGQRVNKVGNVVEAMMTLASWDNNGGDVFASVDYDLVNNNYVLVWVDRAADLTYITVKARRFDHLNATVGCIKTIKTLHGTGVYSGDQVIHLLYQPSRGDFILTRIEKRPDSSSRPFAARISATLDEGPEFFFGDLTGRRPVYILADNSFLVDDGITTMKHMDV